jgi:hypothetical protein
MPDGKKGGRIWKAHHPEKELGLPSRPVSGDLIAVKSQPMFLSAIGLQVSDSKVEGNLSEHRAVTSDQKFADRYRHYELLARGRFSFYRGGCLITPWKGGLKPTSSL